MEPELIAVSKLHTENLGVFDTIGRVRENATACEIAEQKKAIQAIERTRKLLEPERMLEEIPKIDPATGEEIPPWRRWLLAKKKSAEACRAEEDRIMRELEHWREENARKVPEWQHKLAQQIRDHHHHTEPIPKFPQFNLIRKPPQSFHQIPDWAQDPRHFPVSNSPSEAESSLSPASTSSSENNECSPLKNFWAQSLGAHK